MGYRDETDGLRVRVEELESELSTARETIARLQGEGATSQVASEESGWFLGAPTKLHVERELPFEITDAGHEAIAEMLRARMPATGQISQVGRTLTYRVIGVEMKLSRVAPGQTQVRIDADHRTFGGLLGLGIFGGTVLGLIPVAGTLQGLGVSPVSLLVALPLLVVTSFLGLRTLISRHVHNERKKLAGVLESVAEIAARHAVPRRARIAAAPTEAETTAASVAGAEADAEAEAAALETGDERSRAAT